MAKKHWIYIKRGLSEDPKHRERIGQAIWCFMHIVDRADWETGIVGDWRDKDEAADMGVNHRTLQEWRRTLADNHYITCKQTKHGQQITIHNWHDPRNYGGGKMNPYPFEGDINTAPLDANGDTNGDTNVVRNHVTPTYSSKSKSLTIEQRKKEAKQRAAKQRAERASRDPVLEMLKASQDDVPLQAIRRRIEAALHMNLEREWDLPKSDWNGYDKTLLEREQETGQAIEQFMAWYNSNDFRREARIWLKPSKIDQWWRSAFEAPDDDEPEYAFGKRRHAL